MPRGTLTGVLSLDCPRSRKGHELKRVAVIGAVVLLVGACGQDPESEPSSTSGSVTSTTSTTSPTTTTTIPPTTTTLPPTTTTTLPEFPPQREGLNHGGDAWVVILYVSEDFEDPGFVTANEAAEGAGYVTGQTDCDFGAAEAAGFTDGGHYYTMSVYFETEESANRARDAFLARGVDGVVGLVQTYCLD